MWDAALRAKKHLNGGGHSVRAVRIALITDEPLFREGMQSVSEQTQSLIVLDETTIAGAIEVAKSQLADMVVIEATSLRHAIDMVRPLVTCFPEMPVVAVTETANSDEVRSAFAGGIRGCVSKQVEAREFVCILESIFRGGLHLPAELGETFLRRPMGMNGKSREKANGCRFTPRELQILAGVARALTNGEVARELQISEKTVKRYMTVIMEKLEVRSRLEAVLKAKSMD